LFMWQLVAPPGASPDPIVVKAYRAASPVSHVSSTSAPMLLHGDADTTIPFHMAESMRHAMQKAGVDVQLIRLHGGGHDFAGETQRPDWPDFLAESETWMDRHLKPP
jgi:dipeptidyl aminopeptidase/acylaminoacyl peptidase